MEFLVYLTFGQITDPISGGAGWVGAGLLGAVLAWLTLKHLPAKDAQLERIISNHLLAEAAQREHHFRLEEEQRKEYRETLNKIMDHSRTQVEGLAQALRDDLMALHKAIDTLDDTVRLFLKETQK